MKLSLRFLIAVILPVSLIILGNGWFRVRREVRLLTEELTVHQRALARALSPALERALADGGDDAARALLAESNERAGVVELRWHDRSLRTVSPPARPLMRAGRLHSEGGPRVDERIRSFVPIQDRAGTLLGVVELIEPLDREDAYLRATWVRVAANTLVTAAAIALIITLLGWLLVARRVDALVERVRRIGAGARPEPGLPFAGGDELGYLASEIGAMHVRLDQAQSELAAETLRRVRAVEELRHADRLSTVGQLASGMAHELGTPLNVVLGRARMLQEGVPPEKTGPYLEVIIKQVERISGIIRQVLDFSRRAEPLTGPADLLELAERNVKLLRPAAARRGVDLEVEGEPAIVAVDSQQIDQVITNLLMNAIQACGEGDQVRLSVTLDGGSALLQVRDNGPGMTEEIRRQVFDPFFTTKDVGEGTGLGLSVAHGIARDHGGGLSVESQPGEGATFTLRLPREAA